MIIKESIPGTLVIENGKAALRLYDTAARETVYLAYALITQGPGYQVLPSVLLDDWGNEIGHLELYSWIRENGLQFPRAEVFGISPSGAKVQYFLRDLEIFAKYPLYAFADNDAPDSSGVLVQAILVSIDNIESPQPVMPPDEVRAPLRDAQVSWWQVNPRHLDLEFLG